jgi:hypothetical protein
MANQKITELNNNTTINDADLVVIVDDVAGTPVTEKRTIGQLKAHIGGGSGDVTKVGTPADNQIGVWTGDGTIEGDANLTWNGAGTLAVDSDSDSTTGVTLDLYHNSASPNLADGNEIQFYANTSAPAKKQHANMRSVWTDLTLGAEDGSLLFEVTVDGTEGVRRLQLPATINGIRVGASDAAAIVSSNGLQDLILQTGNSTTGNITITDGANGDITVAPNGSSGEFIVKGSGSAGTEGFYAYSGNSYGGFGVDDGAGSYVDAYAETGNTYLQIGDDGAGTIGPNISLYHNSASPAANDVVGKVLFEGEDSASNKHTYSEIKGIITSPTSTTEEGQITLGITTAGTLADRLTFYADSVVPVTNDTYALGSATNQFSDLFLAEGGVINWDNGDATLTQTGNTVALAGANLTVGGLSVTRRSLSVQVTDGTTDVAIGDGKAYITIPEALNGMNLVRAQATVVTAGTTNATTVQIHNKTDAQDMLSGNISIASAGTVGTVGTINGTYDDVATNDVLRIDVDAVSTTAPKGLMVVLEFDLP